MHHTSPTHTHTHTHTYAAPSSSVPHLETNRVEHETGARECSRCCGCCCGCCLRAPSRLVGFAIRDMMIDRNITDFDGPRACVRTHEQEPDCRPSLTRRPLHPRRRAMRLSPSLCLSYTHTRTHTHTLVARSLFAPAHCATCPCVRDVIDTKADVNAVADGP
jgi:hypothetical protein